MAASTRSARARAAASMLFQKPTSRSSWLLVRRSRLVLMSITLLCGHRQRGLPRVNRPNLLQPRVVQLIAHPQHEVGHPLGVVAGASCYWRYEWHSHTRAALRLVLDLG